MLLLLFGIDVLFGLILRHGAVTLHYAVYCTLHLLMDLTFEQELIKEARISVVKYCECMYWP